MPGLSRNPEPSLAVWSHNDVLTASLGLFSFTLSTDGHERAARAVWLKLDSEARAEPVL
jgi:hypothetical protein